MDNRISIKTYVGINNKYTFPSDGYFLGYSPTSQISCRLCGANDTSISINYEKMMQITLSPGTTTYHEFVRKGMKIFCETTPPSDTIVYFFPLI